MSRLNLRHHPSKHDLLAYAESLVDRNVPISAKLAAHVASCGSCLADARQMRACLEVIASSPDLVPSRELTSKILLAAQNRRSVTSRRGPRAIGFAALLRGLAYSTAILVVGFLSFAAAIGRGAPAPAPQSLASTPAPDSRLSPEAIRKATAEIQSLAAAVSFSPSHRRTPIEQEHRRALYSLSNDLAAAQEALARNPGCLRASRLVHMNLQRQAQTLRTLYVERSL